MNQTYKMHYGLIKTPSTSAQTTRYGKLIHMQYKSFSM